MTRPRLISEQVRILTAEQKEVALLCLAFRVHEDDWRKAIDLAMELRPTEPAAAS